MEHPTTREADPEAEAGELINKAIKEKEQAGASSSTDLRREIELNTDGISDEVRRHVDQYVKGVLPAAEGMKVKKLDDGVGGLYNGSETQIATTTLEVRGSIKQTIARSKEVADHETYHAENKHLEAMKVVDSELSENGESEPSSDATLVMGGKEFTQEQLIEGLTVDRTGKEHVSDEYRAHQRNLREAMSAGGIGIEEVEAAVNEEKDLTLIDDRTRGDQKATAPEAQMAA